METTVKIKAIPRLSRIVGWSPKSGKISNWMRMARMNPEPTSITLSNKLFHFISKSFLVYNIHQVSLKIDVGI